MSKLIDAIKLHQTNRLFARRSGPIKYTDMLTINDQSFEPIPHMVEYRIEVSLGASVRWEAGRTTDPVAHNVARMIEQHVFGEFREDLDLIQLALYQMDMDKASELIDAMRAKMFSA